MPGERPAVRIVLRAPIHFDAQSGEPLHAPMVLATVGAIHTRLILDTGSDVHIVTRELADESGLSLGSLDIGTDHAGASLDSWLVGDVPIGLAEAGAAGAPLTLRGVVAIPAPPPFVAGGIGGILSPQRLHDSAFAVIDEIDDELVLVDATAGALGDWLLARRPVPRVISLPRRPADDRPIVEAGIELEPPLPVLVNSGGRHTEFAPEAVPGLVGGGLERIGTGVSGAPVVGANAGPRVLRIGGRRVALPRVMLRSGLTDPPAMLGQDVLRGTVFAVGPDPATPVVWQVEELGDGPGGRPGAFDKLRSRDTLCSSVSAALSLPPVLRQGAVVHAVFR